MTKKAHDRLVRFAIGFFLTVLFSALMWTERVSDRWGFIGLAFAASILLGLEIAEAVKSRISKKDGGNGGK